MIRLRFNFDLSFRDGQFYCAQHDVSRCFVGDLLIPFGGVGWCAGCFHRPFVISFCSFPFCGSTKKMELSLNWSTKKKNSAQTKNSAQSVHTKSSKKYGHWRFSKRPWWDQSVNNLCGLAFLVGRKSSPDRGSLKVHLEGLLGNQ